MQRSPTQPTTITPELLAVASVLTVRQTASVLGLHVETVRAMIRRGEMPAARVGRRALRVPAEYVRQLIDGTAS